MVSEPGWAPRFLAKKLVGGSIPTCLTPPMPAQPHPPEFLESRSGKPTGSTPSCTR